MAGIFVQVFCKVKNDKVEAFKAASMENASNSVREPGILRFDVIQQKDDATKFCLIEIYRSNEAINQHKETAHYKKWNATVADMMAEPRSKQVYNTCWPPMEGFKANL